MIRIGITGLIGYETACRLKDEHEMQLKERFSARFLKEFDELRKIAGNICIPEKMHSAGIRFFEITQGGLFGTLWKALDELESSGMPVRRPVGCRVDLAQVPVMQEIVEICELYDENPYEAASRGAYVVIWDEDADFDRTAIEQAAPAGCITCSRDRLIYNGDMIRYLTPPGRQAKDIESRQKDRKEIKHG